MRQQHKADDDAPGNISQHHLEKRQVGVICEAGNADDSQGAGFRRNDGKRNRPPGNIASGEEVVAKGVLSLAETQAEQSDPDEIDGDDREIETVQAHGACISVARLWSNLMSYVEGYQGSDQWWARSMSENDDFAPTRILSEEGFPRSERLRGRSAARHREWCAIDT